MRAPMTPVPYVVVQATDETTDIRTLILEPAGPERIASGEPGRFNMLYAFGVGEAAISLSRCNQHARLTHTIRRQGAASRVLATARAGDMTGVRGPFGRGWTPPAPDEDVIVVAGGLGLAPLRPLLDALAASGSPQRQVTLLFGARSPETLLFRDDLDAWASTSGFVVHTTVDSAPAGWSGNVGTVTKLLNSIEPSTTRPRRAYICGPEIMMRHLAAALMDLGVAGRLIELSLERNMKCAIRHCGHCQFGADFVCRDGPVFPYDRIRERLLIREI